MTLIRRLHSIALLKLNEREVSYDFSLHSQTSLTAIHLALETDTEFPKSEKLVPFPTTID